MADDFAGQFIAWVLDDNKMPTKMKKVKNSWYVKRQTNPLWKGFASAANMLTYNEILITQGDFFREDLMPGSLDFDLFKTLKTHYMPGVDSVPTYDWTDDANAKVDWVSEDPFTGTALKWKLTDFQSIDDETLTITTVTITWVAIGCPFQVTQADDPCDTQPPAA